MKTEISGDTFQNKNIILFASCALGSGLLTSLVYQFYSKRKRQQQEKYMQEYYKNQQQSKEGPRRNPQILSQPILVRQVSIPEQIKNSKNTLTDEINYLQSTNEVVKVSHLKLEFNMQDMPTNLSPLYGENNFRTVYGGGGFLPDIAFTYAGHICLAQTNFMKNENVEDAKRYIRAGPRKYIFFNPKRVKAAIVTCGGLCPGLNVVIRELFMCLNFNYGVKDIYAIQFGYKGFYSFDWQKLSIHLVKEIQRQGGTFIGSSRGGFDIKKICDSLQEKQINQLYCLGGDGTHRGMKDIYEECKRRGMQLSVVGIPKTIDNDIQVIDKSFGFETSVEEAQKAIKSAYIESHCAEFGVGLVRLMGRYAGFIALEASNASRDVNVCLIPEFKFKLYGDNGVLEYVFQRLKKRGHCIIVVAEGAGDAILDLKVDHAGKDPSGNVLMADIGNILKNEVVKYGKDRGMDITLKYIDPTYMIRTVPANSGDKKMCTQLAQNAVHGAMAGYTGFTVGHVNNKLCMIPIDEITKGGVGRKVKATDTAWQRFKCSSGQPSFLDDQ